MRSFASCATISMNQLFDSQEKPGSHTEVFSTLGLSFHGLYLDHDKQTSGHHVSSDKHSIWVHKGVDNFSVSFQPGFAQPDLTIRQSLPGISALFHYNSCLWLIHVAKQSSIALKIPWPPVCQVSRTILLVYPPMFH